MRRLSEPTITCQLCISRLRLRLNLIYVSRCLAQRILPRSLGAIVPRNKTTRSQTDLEHVRSTFFLTSHTLHGSHVVIQYFSTAHPTEPSIMAEPDDSIFSHVLSAFRLRMSPQDISDFQSTTFEDLKAEITAIQRKQAQRRGFRNLNRVRPFINGIEQYSKVIEVFVNAKPDIMAFVWVRNFQTGKRYY